MAKSRSRSAHRVVSTPSLTRLVAPVYRLPSVSPVFGDRRVYHPLGRYRRAVSLGRLYESMVVAKRDTGVAARRSKLFSPVIRFAEPHKISICVRRQQRREVLFAKRKMFSGKGGSRRRNFYSGVSCK